MPKATRNPPHLLRILNPNDRKQPLRHTTDQINDQIAAEIPEASLLRPDDLQLVRKLAMMMLDARAYRELIESNPDSD